MHEKKFWLMASHNPKMTEAFVFLPFHGKTLEDFPVVSYLPHPHLTTSPTYLGPLTTMKHPCVSPLLLEVANTSQTKGKYHSLLIKSGEICVLENEALAFF